MDELAILRMEQEANAAYNSNYNNNNNNNRNYYDPTNEYLEVAFGPVGQAAMASAHSEGEDLTQVIETYSLEDLGMPVENNLNNIASHVIQRLILQTDLPMTTFDAVLSRFPEIVAPAAEPGNHTLSNILAAILEENQKERPFEDVVYMTHPHINVERLKDFLEYLRNRDPSIKPGYEFFMTVLQTGNRDILAYLVDKQLPFVREMMRILETTPDPRIPAAQVTAMRQRLAFEARKHMLHVLRPSRRGGRRRHSRRRRTCRRKTSRKACRK